MCCRGVVVLTVLALAGSVAADDVLDREWKAIEGTWTSMPPEGSNAPMLTVVFTRGKVMVTLPGNNQVTATVVLDPKTTPKCIDLKVGEKNLEIEGIYAVDGDTLKVCVGEPDQKDRPTAFPDTPTAERFVVLKRVKP